MSYWKILKRLGVYPMWRRAVRLGGPEEGRPWLSWSNENELPGGRYGTILKNGQAWFHWRDNCAGCQWVLGRLRFGWELEVGGIGCEHDLSGHFYLPGLSFYWHIDRCLPKAWTERNGYDSRVLGFDLRGGALWVKCWAPGNGWDSKQPKWMDWNFDCADFFFGKTRYSQRVLRKVPVEVPLPEGVYPGSVEVEESTWKRPRWPWAKRVIRTHIETERYIPIPGKGENSWDCGDDGIDAQSCRAETPEDAVGELVKTVLKYRSQRGGRDWKPVQEVVA